MGYPLNQKGWRLYDPDTQFFFVSHDVIFYESTLPYSIPLPPTSYPPNRRPLYQPDDDFESSSDDSPQHTTPLHDQPETHQPRTQHGNVPTTLPRDPPLSQPTHHDPTPTSPTTTPLPAITQTQQNVAPRPTRERRPPSYLKQYICNNSNNNNKTSNYPLTSYVSYDQFTPSHRYYPAAIINTSEPKLSPKLARIPNGDMPCASKSLLLKQTILRT